MVERSDRPRIVLAGSVGSTRRTLAALIRHRLNVVGVLGLRVEKSANVSGYARLDDLANAASIPYAEFDNINTPETIAMVQEWSPDVLFVVGLSQLVGPELLALPRLGCVGFHPTHLPEGRGRAPVAWLTMENRPGAATFFVMDEGADSGPILAQEPFEVTGQDYASDVIRKLEDAIDVALDRWLPHLNAGEWEPLPQDDRKATYYGRRSPSDGLIDWNRPAREILALVRATSHPHPGAYTYAGGEKMIIWKASLEKTIPYRGVPGRILVVDEHKGFLVQTGDGLLWLEQVEAVTVGESRPELRLGMKLGYVVEDEINKLAKRIQILEERLSRLENEGREKT